MKVSKYTTAITLSVVFLIGCDRSGRQEATTEAVNDSAVVASVSADLPSTADTTQTTDSNDTYDPWSYDSLNILPPAPLLNIHVLSWRAIQAKNGLKKEIDSNELTEQEAQRLSSLEDKAWNAIQAYEKAAAEGIFISEPPLKLLGLARHNYAFGDEAPTPSVEADSRFVSDGDFFFLGGSPFISKEDPDENNTVYHDDKGNPEIRFVSDVPENTRFLLKWLVNLRKERFNLSYGPPLNDYEYGEQHVYNVGSIKHELVSRTPALFLTEKGLVPAQLVSVTVKLVPTYHCSSENPRIEFACKQSIDANDILGVWIPAATPPPTTCTITHIDNVWTADLDGDGIPDLAAVNTTFTGASADNMNEVYWYLNVNGEWELIERSSEVDCT